jgi:hypothetical protein
METRQILIGTDHPVKAFKHLYPAESSGEDQVKTTIQIRINQI